MLLLTLIQLVCICKGELLYGTQTTNAKNAAALDEIVRINRTHHQQHVDARTRSRSRRKKIDPDGEKWEASTNLSRSSRGIGDSMKNMWKKMRGKKQQWDLSREEASDVYKEYNKCVTKRFSEVLKMEKGQMKPVHAIMALQGERIALKCTVW